MKNIIILFILCLALSNCSQEQSYIEKYLIEITDMKSFSGSVLVSVQGELVVNQGYGLADYENDLPNTSKSVHRIGSLTKQFTSMAILKLIGSNDSLSVESTIDQFFPGLPETWKEVTLFQLLTHTSGIPNHFGDLDAVPVEDTYKELEKVMSQEQESELQNTPGENFSYNNFGYILLGRVIEILSGKSYSEYLEEKIFVPLGMSNTQYDDSRNIVKGRSEGYKLKNGNRVNDALKDPAGYSAGGLLSTTEDLNKWYQSLKSDIVLDELTRELMFTPNKADYGLGWQIVKKEGRTMYNHNGGTHGYDSRMVFYPEEDVFIVILGNNEDIRAAAIMCDIEGLIFSKEDHVVGIPFDLSADQQNAFDGTYKTTSGKERGIKVKNGKSYYVNGNSEFELTPLSEDELAFSDYGDIRLSFDDNKKSFTISTCTLNPEVYMRQ